MQTESFKPLLINVSLCLALVLATLCAYRDMGQHHFFLWDSLHFVLFNEHLHKFSLANIEWILSHSFHGNWLPLTSLSHMLDFHWFGVEANGHHWMNLAIHLVNSCLLYLVIARLFRFAGAAGSKAQIGAFITAFIFAVHPQHVESVAMIAQRKDTLYFCFMMLGLLGYFSYVEQGRPWYRSGGYLVTFVCLALSLSAKSMAVTTPLLLLVLDAYPLGRITGVPSMAKLKPVLIDKIALLFLAAISVVITLQTQAVAMPLLDDFSLLQRVQNTLHNIGFYLWKFMVPINLSPFYPLPPLKEQFPLVYWLPSLVFILVTSILAIYLAMRKSPLLLTCWVSYLIILSPVSGIVHVGPAASTDHYTYAATIPSALLLAALITRGLDWQPKSRGVIVGLALFTGLALIALTNVQLSHWRSPLGLWSRAAELHPGAALPRQNLAAAYMFVGDFSSALEQLYLLRSWGLDVDQSIASTEALAGRTSDAISTYTRMIESGKYAGDQLAELEQARQELEGQ